MRATKEEKGASDSLWDITSRDGFKVPLTDVTAFADGQVRGHIGFTTEARFDPSNLTVIYEETESMFANMIEGVIQCDQ